MREDAGLPEPERQDQVSPRSITLEIVAAVGSCVK
jgi:hypothetical protein